MEVAARVRRGPLGLLVITAKVVAAAGAAAAVAFGGSGLLERTESAPPPSSAPAAAPVTPSPSPSPSPSPTPAADPDLTRAQERLAALGYWVGPADGRDGPVTRSAVMAFQKVEGLGRDGVLGPRTLEALDGASAPSPAFPGPRHVEIDLAAQVMMFVDGGRAHHVLAISSGSGEAFTSEGWTRRAVTPRGHFRVGRKISGWRVSPLGKLHYPSYIVGGIAIHGSPSVPPYPASHGCIRVPMWASTEVSGMLPIGTRVIVHSNGAAPQERDVASPPGLDTPDASEPTSPETTPAPTPAPAATPEPEPQETPGSPTPEPTPSGDAEPPRSPRPPDT